jgi:plasmid stabilization system protein ParE
MERQIIWTKLAEKNLINIVAYLEQNWSKHVLDTFKNRLKQKLNLLQTNPNLGFKSSIHSRYRKTIITTRYILVYTYSKKSLKSSELNTAAKANNENLYPSSRLFHHKC